MKPIIVNEKNVEKMIKEIDTVQNRCTARTIEYFHIVNTVMEIENKYNLTKKQLEGCKFDVDMYAQDFPRAYKYTADSTQFTIVMEKGKWRITDIDRYATRKSGQRIIATLTDEAKTAILNKYICF